MPKKERKKEAIPMGMVMLCCEGVAIPLTCLQQHACKLYVKADAGVCIWISY